MIYVHVCDLQCPKMPLIIEELKHKSRMEIEIIFPYKLNISFKVSFKITNFTHVCTGCFVFAQLGGREREGVWWK